MPEQDGPEDHRGIDHPVVPGSIGLVPHAVDEGENQDQDDQEYHQPDQRGGGPVAAVGAGAVQVAQAVVVHIELVQLQKQIEDTVAIFAALNIRLERAVYIGGDLAASPDYPLTEASMTRMASEADRPMSMPRS